MSEKTVRWHIPSFIFISGIIMLIVGVPRFLGELMLVPSTPIHERFSRGWYIKDSELKVLENSSLQALQFTDLPQAYNNLSASYLEQARRTHIIKVRENYARKSIAATTKSLRLTPLNPYAWERLCAANVLLGQSHYATAINAWRISIAIAQFDPRLLIPRIHLGIIFYDFLTEKDIGLLKHQLEMAYHWNREELKKYTTNNKLENWMIYLAKDKIEMEKFLRK